MKTALGEVVKKYTIDTKHGIDCIRVDDDNTLHYLPWYRRTEESETFYYTWRGSNPTPYARIECQTYAQARNHISISMRKPHYIYASKAKARHYGTYYTDQGTMPKR